MDEKDAMTLVEKLRAYNAELWDGEGHHIAPPCVLIAEAADALERETRAANELAAECYRHEETIAALRAELASMQTDFNQLYDRYRREFPDADEDAARDAVANPNAPDGPSTIAALRAENMRVAQNNLTLRAENERWIRGLRAAKDARADHVDMILRKDQEIERLRAALEKIANYPGGNPVTGYYTEIARSALTGEGEK